MACLRDELSIALTFSPFPYTLARRSSARRIPEERKNK
jgi:hypothetical protein